MLFKLHGFADVPYRQMLIAYEHHMKLDLSGYPTNKRSREPTLFSRIVSVADAFDAGTSVRSYQYNPWPPDAVLKEMRDNPRRGFDPLLVKALITATGVYPIGTLCILDTHELAVVAQVNPESRSIAPAEGEGHLRSHGGPPGRDGDARPRQGRPGHRAARAHHHQDDGPAEVRDSRVRLPDGLTTRFHP